ncbi:transcriptional regulator, XRE family protein [Streptomyces sp. XH2]|uniref:transcriptional regulator, XRE family protein n=1 Tax=Streptomyces sp. XH2 TaxID=3412483 RepID=UPI003C7998AC
MRPTLFRLLLQERRWDTWVVFCEQFEPMARRLAAETNCPRLASVTVSRATFDRWCCGEWYGRPRRDTARVLEALLGFSADELFSPAPETMQSRLTQTHDRGGLQASLAISRRWPTSRLFLSAAHEVADAWELQGRRLLDGTTTAVQFHPASVREGAATLQTGDLASLDGFLRPARRGLLVGVDEREEDVRLYVVDSWNARRVRSALPGRDDAMVLSAAHLLDDLSYGILWALVQLDDGLLADDQVLDAEQEALAIYLSLDRSAPSRMSVPGLSSVGASWLGSMFCARHLERHLSDAARPPVFFTREQTGEEAATWLLYRHKVDYLRSQTHRFVGGTPLSRAFCIPEGVVRRSARYERILLFLAVALMEHHGVQVRVTPRPEFGAVDGFALIPGQRAVVATWVRTDALWKTDAVATAADLRHFADLFNDAGSDSVAAGPDPCGRLRVLADYLALDWGWLTVRCRELGALGVARLVRPRSRLLSVDALNEVLRFVGRLAHLL